MSWLLSREERAKGIVLPPRSPMEIYRRQLIRVRASGAFKFKKELTEFFKAFKSSLQSAIDANLDFLPVCLYGYFSIIDRTRPEAKIMRGM